MFTNLEQLIKTIRERKNFSSNQSYTNKLLNDPKLSVSKVKEEIEELFEAVEKNSNNSSISSFTFETLSFLSFNNLLVYD